MEKAPVATLQDSSDSLRRAGASTVCAVLDMIGIPGTVAGLRALVPLRAFAGPAFTVKVSVGPLGSCQPGDFDISSYADHARSGDVIAIDAGGANVSVAGGIAALATRLRGVEAWVVDGGMRDVDELREAGLPIHLREGTAVSGRTRVRVERIGGPILVGGLEVQPGDILVGDGSGIGRVPLNLLAQVTRMSAWITGRDGIARSLVLEGRSFSEAFSVATAQHGEVHGPLG